MINRFRYVSESGEMTVAIVDAKDSLKACIDLIINFQDLEIEDNQTHSVSGMLWTNQSRYDRH